MTAIVAPRFGSALAVQARVVVSLMLREMRMHAKHSRLSYLLELLEPVLQLTMMLAVFSAIGRRPDFGTSMFLFLGTGMIPYFTFVHISSRAMGALRSTSLARNLPLVKPLDLMLARAFLEILQLAIVMIVLFGFIYFVIGVRDARPIQPLNAVGAFAAAALMAIGVGIVNGIIGSFFRLWAVVYGVFARSLLFLSAVFYVPDYMPKQIRDWLVWNPVLHAVEWFRTAFFLTYPTVILDKGYLLSWGIGSIFLGLILERALRRRRVAAR
ncbi:capsular polysaccharide transport system permease protein [Inquilinus ginsengisoli]|uniref:Capsular polysaccharide transport system permease protein n=1 Tax=Inquilinus ginsengisoli TaxID=363840 RepID=A0ABU1JPY5_9PROT|nr:ABC transporter permease [Inquilinus ginsengisoli]MDR6290672.1 capsular polysaccharide transport system permease protein [Inquilinus ginsengisoli]